MKPFRTSFPLNLDWSGLLLNCNALTDEQHLYYFLQRSPQILIQWLGWTGLCAGLWGGTLT